MRNSAHNYFEELFRESNEFVICIDDKLNIVFASKRVQSVIFRGASFSHLCNILPLSTCNFVENAMRDKPHSISFDFVSIGENLPRSCVVIPTVFESIYYYILHISNTNANALDKLQRQDLEAMVDVSAKTLAQCTVPIMELAATLEDDKKSLITANIRSIRKLFSDIEILATEHTSQKRPKVIDLHSYMKAVLEKIQVRLGKNSFEYTLLPPANMHLSLINTDVLDIMVVTIITEIIILNRKKAHIFATLWCDDTKNFIVISNSHHGLGYKPNELLDQSADDRQEITNEKIATLRSIVAKVARDNGAKAFFTTTIGDGVTHGIMLKRSKSRQMILSEELDEYKNDFELLDILLSDINFI